MDTVITKIAVKWKKHISVSHELHGSRTYTPDGGTVTEPGSRPNEDVPPVRYLLGNNESIVKITDMDPANVLNPEKMSVKTLVDFAAGECDMCNDSRVCLYDTYNIHDACKGRGIIFRPDTNEWVKCPNCYMGVVPYVSISPAEKKCPACCWRY